MDDRVILGVFTNKSDAEDALSSLEDFGYNPKDISLVMRDMNKVKEGVGQEEDIIARDTISGAVAGGVLGALAGLLVATGVVPGLGVLFIGGPLATSLGLTGAAATTVSGATTGVLAGGFLGALASLGVPESEARLYEESIRRGEILLIVPVLRGDEREVSRILENYGANQVTSTQVPPKSKVRFTPSQGYREGYFPAAGQKGGKASTKKRRRR
ncbi:MAG: hypothetical protein M1142_01405 [Patescibacteria group bacterium]|nr:hypothetical protein [Patescibacteria group bacterium]